MPPLPPPDKNIPADKDTDPERTNGCQSVHLCDAFFTDTDSHTDTDTDHASRTNG